MERVKLLVDIILDKSADVSDREDALTDLSDYTDDFVVEALFTIILDEEEDIYIRTDATETLAFIWLKLNKYDIENFKKIPYGYQRDICEIVQKKKPNWILAFENATGKKLI